VGKTQTLHKAAQGGVTSLRALVQADVAAKRATVKDSCTRNLHRLITAVGFVRGLLENFVASPATTPCNAARQAYEQVRELPSFHSNVQANNFLTSLPRPQAPL
jgi:hypothetical protein